ncbi:MAG: hypothetical protein ACE5G6_01275 [Terriglobia bacterium]
MSDKLKLPLGSHKEPEADDPAELVATRVPGGDPELMATCLIEEYARIGLKEEEIFALFQQPIYQTHALYRERGESWVRNRIREVLSRTGRMRVSIQFRHPTGGGDA